LSNVTISSGSVYTGRDNSTTYIQGTIVNNGTLALASAGNNTQLRLANDTTLTGGGTVILNNSNAYLLGFNVALTNVDNTIQGAGQIGAGGVLTLVNGSLGTINANGVGGNLNIGAGGGSFLNNGTVKVAAGTTMSVFGDANGFLQNQVGGITPLTQVEGNLVAPNGVNIVAGVLEGTGTVTGNVVSAGTVHPGDSPGVLTILGNYTQLSEGTLSIVLAGLNPGTQYSVLDVNGSAALAGLLDVDLMAGLTLALGDTFQIMEFANSTSDFSSFEFDGKICSAGGTDQWACAQGLIFAEQFAGNDRALNLVVENAGTPGSTPLPSSWIMMLTGLAGFGVVATYRRRKNAAYIVAA
jgi:hypothetical protein